MSEDFSIAERIEGTHLAKRIVCKICQEDIYSVSEKPSQVEIDRELHGMILHMKLRHDLDVRFHRCSDPKCVRPHQS